MAQYLIETKKICWVFFLHKKIILKSIIVETVYCIILFVKVLINDNNIVTYIGDRILWFHFFNTVMVEWCCHCPPLKCWLKQQQTQTEKQQSSMYWSPL